MAPCGTPAVDARTVRAIIAPERRRSDAGCTALMQSSELA